MIDVFTKRPLRVSVDGTAGPYLMVAVDQVGEVERRLRAADVRGYWVDPEATRIGGRPAFTVFNFGRYGNAEQVQRLLDDA